ncbi:hypothetical protein ACLQ24_08660 [Micromonospora sp. DT4]|uniref:hypothetical protein n=1 Tax=Micromonospora sp. DT4 TaxID=3393438 RepID=UPI003CE89BCE
MASSARPRRTNLDGNLTFDAGIVVCARCRSYDSFNIADANNDGNDLVRDS